MNNLEFIKHVEERLELTLSQSVYDELKYMRDDEELEFSEEVSIYDIVDNVYVQVSIRTQFLNKYPDGK